MNTTRSKPSEYVLVIAPEGTLQFLWDDALAPLLDLGEGAICRASYVEPAGTQWIADLSPVGGPVLGPYPLRQEALQAEICWLQHHLLRHSS